MRHFLFWLVIAAVGATIPMIGKAVGIPRGVSFGLCAIAGIIAGTYFHRKVLH